MYILWGVYTSNKIKPKTLKHSPKLSRNKSREGEKEKEERNQRKRKKKKREKPLPPFT